MNSYKLLMKNYRLFLGRFRVFSQSDEKEFAMAGHSLNVQPEQMLH